MLTTNIGPIARRLFAAAFVLIMGVSAARADDIHQSSSMSFGSRYFDSEPSRATSDRPTEQADFAAACKTTCPNTLFQWSYCPSFEGGAPGFDEPLVTDRPDFTESPVTVGLGVAQLEYGYKYSYDVNGGQSTVEHSYPEMLLRVGIMAEWLELRVDWNYGERRERVSGTVSRFGGPEDLGLGLKIALTPQAGWLPEMGLIVQARVPTGEIPFTSDGEVLPGVNWIYGWELCEDLSLTGSTQGNRAVESTGNVYLEMAQSFALGYSLTERYGMYLEWYGLFPDGAVTTGPQQFFNGGFTYLINNNYQLDVFAGLGLNDASTDYFIGTGGAIRF